MLSGSLILFSEDLGLEVELLELLVFWDVFMAILVHDGSASLKIV